jgi:tRNA nucleotidyltransferase/poly(A) polymerase
MSVPRGALELLREALGGTRGWLVGGAVRDELRGLGPGADLDVVVDGDVGAAAKALARAAGGAAAFPLSDEFGAWRVVARAHAWQVDLGPLRGGSIEADLALRDFTVNAMARPLGGGGLVDPLGGAADLERRTLRTVSPRSFEEDPLRLLRGLRFVSQLGFDPEEQTLAQMRANAASIRLVSAERIGGGLHADGLGELSRLLLGAEPARALRIARDTGVLAQLLPEFEATFGFVQSSKRQNLTLDEHIFAVVQAAADQGANLRVRLTALFHDLGKPHEASHHARRSAELATVILRRLRYPTALRRAVVELVRWHSFHLEEVSPLTARRFLHQHGEERALDLVAHRLADLAGKKPDQEDRAQTEELRRLLLQEREQPHTLGQLAVDGSDLIELGVSPGPALGTLLETLLGEVVDDPAGNTRERLLARARELTGAPA